MKFEELIELIKTVSDSKVTSFSYDVKNADMTGTIEHITIKKSEKDKKPEVCVVPPMQMPMAASMPAAQMPVAMPQMQAVQPMPQETAETAIADDADCKIVKSPLVGTFYSAASPDDEPFVKVGDRVKKGQKLGIIEAMKLMNDIESDFDGEIVEIMVSNENMVEYGQPLFKIK